MKTATGTLLGPQKTAAHRAVATAANTGHALVRLFSLCIVSRCGRGVKFA